LNYTQKEFLICLPEILIKSFMRYISIAEEEAAKKMLEIWEKSNK
jgi:hypothetical protein